MLYRLSTYKLYPGKAQEFHQEMQRFIPFMEKQGVKTVGCWQTFIGEGNEFIFLWGHENMAELQRYLEALSTQEEAQRHSRTLATVIASSHNRILRSAPYSPLK